ncbi:MAG: GyrI-like domain-containing protein [Bacteroidetes bacterium]|nr:GyrI-like domain-containing protein [Bacteroidota bacterium]
MTEAVLDVTTVHLPERTLAYIRNVGPYAGNTVLFEQLFNRVSKWALGKGLLTPESEAITVYLDDPESVPEELQRINVGFTVPAGTKPDGEFHVTKLPEADYVVGSFEIAPHHYREAWMSVFAYMGESGLVPHGPMYESYKNDPSKHPEGKHVVDICVAVK